MSSRFKIGERVKINWSPENGGVKYGTVARVEFCFGYLYYVNVDEVGCKFVNAVMMEHDVSKKLKQERLNNENNDKI